ncbi:PEFG-CTERM sorting domain-containing protein [Candidatus Nitrosotenuis uzonensis]|uniref:Blue (Type 1) copper domain protein n=1 Tax=Candidatus Nitrosotenuis uzonensis TaxID=1407055 RepID=V6AR76_9ARCH|nr:PEFG-CTERM sorting domain-containing protein [Candidatus Nitrosotenuis uzonensis]CDI04923.1 Blue (Type 1) copper domain protein [Candidatus Nitrosotenuis uzonensis]
MKTIAIGSIFAVLALMMVAPSAFADHATVEVSIPAGSSSPGCETTNECFIPHEAVIDVGSEVVWTNDDTAAHTVTSGDIKAGGPDGNFDSGLFMAGKTFSHKFEEEGEFPYFCLVHPWMQGVVIVQAAHDDDHHDKMTDKDGEMMDHDEPAIAMTADGSWMVKIHADKPTAGEELVLEVEFESADGKSDHANYEITATQDGQVVLTEEGHIHPGDTGLHITDALSSDSPVDVQVTILGFGLPDADPATWTGPKGETISARVVPEFGQIAMMILAVAIISIVAVTARSKVIPRL